MDLIAVENISAMMPKPSGGKSKKWRNSVFA